MINKKVISLPSNKNHYSLSKSVSKFWAATLCQSPKTFAKVDNLDNQSLLEYVM